VSARVTLLVGVLILVGAVALFPHAGQRECVTSVERVTDVDEIDQTEIAGVPDVIGYEDLSEKATEVFDRARSRGEVTVHGSACPERFYYTQYPATYALEASGDYFRVVTESEGGAWPVLELLYPGSFALLGKSSSRQATVQSDETRMSHRSPSSSPARSEPSSWPRGSMPSRLFRPPCWRSSSDTLASGRSCHYGGRFRA